jgi:hypothetical protein
MKQLQRVAFLTAVIVCGLASTRSTPQPARATGQQRVWHGTIENITGVTCPLGMCFNTTLFTPPATGQYRLSLYSQIAQPDATSDAIWNVGLQWYDGAGTEQATALQQLKSANTFPNAWGSPNGAGGQPGSVSTFVTAKVTPIFLDVVKSHDDLAIGRIYWTIELIQPLETF